MTDQPRPLNLAQPAPNLTARSLSALVVLAALHILLALWFASFTPYRTAGRIGNITAPDIGAPDERAHANVIQHVLDGKGFPALDIQRMRSDATYRQEDYEDHQPPLYYVIAAGWARVVGVSDISNLETGGRIRWLNALIGGSTVVAVFFAALWGFQRVDVAFAAALFPAFLPMNIALSGAISNDPLLFALLTWCLALCSRGIATGWTPKLSAGVGLLAGLAFLTKTSGLAIFPVLFVAGLLPQFRRPKAIEWGIALGILLVITLPWINHNLDAYHDPLATRVFNEAFSDTPQRGGMVAMIHSSSPDANAQVTYWVDWVGWWTARSFIGVFGYMDIWLNEKGSSYTGPGGPNTLYRLCLGVLAFLALGWLLSLKEARDPAKPAPGSFWSVTALNGVFLAIIGLLFIRFDMQFFQAQARYLYPALGPLAIGFGWGLVTLAPKKPFIAIAVLGISLVLLDFYAGATATGLFQGRMGVVSRSMTRPLLRNALPARGVLV